MRFHMGVSFSWRSIKKIIFPILLGILAYFGFNFLGLGIIQVNALENYNTSYSLTYSELEVLDTKVDDTYTYNQFFDYVNNLESQYYNLIIGVNFYHNNDSDYNVGLIRFQLMPVSVSSYPVAIYGKNTYPQGFYLRPFGNQSPRYYDIQIYNNSITDILQNTTYVKFLNCYQNNSCSGSTGSVFDNQYNFAHFSSYNFSNDNSYIGTFPYFNSSFLDGTTNNYALLYSTKVPLYYSNTFDTSNNSILYKKIFINDKELEIGDYVPTYKDFLDSLDSPSDDPTDDPTDDSEHKAIFNKIYWFDDNTTELGVLSNIYILLFLYCITMIFFKIATLLKNKRW